MHTRFIEPKLADPVGPTSIHAYQHKTTKHHKNALSRKMATLSGRPQYTPTTSKKAYGAGAQWVLPSTVSRQLASVSLSLMKPCGGTVFVSGPSTTSHKTEGGAEDKAAARAGLACRCTAWTGSTSQCCRHQRRGASGTRRTGSLAEGMCMCPMCSHTRSCRTGEAPRRRHCTR